MLCFGLVFLLACHYFGPGVNLALLFYPSLLLVGLCATKTSRLVSLQQSEPTVFWLTIGWLGTLAVHHLLFSLSPESSFAVSMALALIGVVLLYVLASPTPVAFYRVAFWIMFVFATFASVKYVLSGERAFTPVADPNNLVTLVFLAWVPWAHKSLATRSEPKRWYWATAISSIFVLAALATQSRFAIGVIGLLLGFWWLGVVVKQLELRPTMILSAGVLMAGLVYWLLSPATGPVVGGAEEAVAESQVASERLLLLQSAWQLVQQHGGWLGTGVYSFSLLYPSLRSLSEQGTAGLYVHNDYFQLVQEGGVLFAVFFVALLIWFVRTGFRRLRAGILWRSDSGFLAAVGITLLHANFNFTFYILPIGMLFAVVFANALRAEILNSGISTTSKPQLWLVRFGVVVLFVVVGRLGLEAYNYAVFSGQKGLPLAQSLAADSDSQLRFSQLSDRLVSDQGIVQFAQAQIYAYQSVSDDEPNTRVLKLYRQAIESDPWNPSVRLKFAEYLNYYQLGEQAAIELAAAHALNPQDIEISRALMQTLWQLGRRDEVEQVAQHALAWCPLIGRRGPALLDELGSYVASLNRSLQSPIVAEQLATCRTLRESLPPGPSREPSWVMRWFGVGAN